MWVKLTLKLLTIWIAKRLVQFFLFQMSSRCTTWPLRTPACWSCWSRAATPCPCPATGASSESTFRANEESRSHHSNFRTSSRRPESWRWGPRFRRRRTRRTWSRRWGRRSGRSWERSTSTTRSCTTHSSSGRPSPGWPLTGTCTMKERSLRSGWFQKFKQLLCYYRNDALFSKRLLVIFQIQMFRFLK